MSSFSVNNTGQIAVGSGTKLDYEGKRTYMVTVTATDPLGASTSIPVTIEVTDVDEAPDISGDDTISYPEKGTGAVATYTASDPEGASVRWSLGGVDAADFTIDNGVLRFAKTPDYERPRAAQDHVHGQHLRGGRPGYGRDPEDGDGDGHGQCDQRGRGWDGGAVGPAAAVGHRLHRHPGRSRRGISNAKWQWSKSSSKNGAYRPIDKATSATYMPKDGDIGSYLRATVTYTDPEGEDKTAKMESAFTVQGVRGSNMAPEFAADQDPNTPGIRPCSAVCGGEHRSRLDRGRPGDGGPQGRRCADLHAVG